MSVAFHLQTLLLLQDQVWMSRTTPYRYKERRIAPLAMA